MASGAQKGARQRKWNKEFNSTETVRMLLGAESSVAEHGMGRLPSGEFVSVYPATPGRFTVRLVDTMRSRTFPMGQLDVARQWIASGGKLDSEERKKRLVKNAEKMLNAIVVSAKMFEFEAQSHEESGYDQRRKIAIPLRGQARLLRDIIKEVEGE